VERRGDHHCVARQRQPFHSASTHVIRLLTCELSCCSEIASVLMSAAVATSKSSIQCEHAVRPKQIFSAVSTPVVVMTRAVARNGLNEPSTCTAMQAAAVGADLRNHRQFGFQPGEARVLQLSPELPTANTSARFACPHPPACV